MNAPRFWLSFICIGCFTCISCLATTASALTRGSVSVEGISGRPVQQLRDVIARSIPSEFDLSDVQRAMADVYSLGTFNGIDVFYEEDGGRTNIIFRIFPVRLVKALNFLGAYHFSNLELANEMSIAENEGLTQDKLKSGVENVKRFYNLNGYLNAQVKAEAVNSENGTDVVVNVTVEENEPCKIDQINLQSVNDGLNRHLYRTIRKNIGKIFTQDLLNSMQKDAVDYLLNEQYYTAQLQAPEMIYNAVKTRVNLNYVISDPYTYALVFEGNEVFNRAKIIKELNLNTDNRLSSSPVEDLTERILRFYKREGYANVTVKHRENLYSQDFTRRLTFTIHEGPRVHIRDIFIEGTISRPQKYYRSFIYGHSGDQVENRIYNSDEVDNGVKNLVTELQNQGFISAKVPSVRTDFDRAREFAKVYVDVEEGPRTFVDRIDFKGIKNTSAAELQDAIGLHASEPLQLSRVEDATARILEVYHNKGFLEAQVANQGKNIISYSADNTKATLHFDINEGAQIKVAAVVVEGNTFTKDYVILRELQFQKGDVLTPDKIGYSEQRLQALSIFNSVDIRPLEDDPRQGNRTVLVRVNEHSPGVFKSGIGVNNDVSLTVRGFVGTAYRNLWGTGRGINARLEVNEKLPNEKLRSNFSEYDGNFGYTEPFILGTQNTGRLNFTLSRKLWSIDPTTDQTLAVDSAQGDLVLERDLSRKVKLAYDLYGVARTNTFEIYGKSPSTPLVIATTGPTILFDGRDNPFNPTRGYTSSFSFEYSNPYMGNTKTVNYYKTVGSYSRYLPWGRTVLALEGKAGYLKNLSDLVDGGVPDIKTFFLGGRSTIRGFDPVAETIPLRSDLKLKGQSYVLPTEEYFLLAKAEYRFPLVGNLGAAIFYDGGQVNFPDYHPRFSWRDATGIGLRYITPIGPVSLDWGFKLNRDESRNEALSQIHFSIGVF